MFEAGALSKSLQDAYVCPYLFGFTPADIRGPLVQFQAASATKDGTRALIRTLNRALGESALVEARLDQAFDVWWPRLEKRLAQIASTSEEQPPQTSEPDQSKQH